MSLFINIRRDPVGDALGTRMVRFESSVGIDGLMRENRDVCGGMIEVLAVVARNRGSGQFREFVRRLKLEYSIICFWHIDNPMLRDALARYGFADEVMIDEHGDTVTGMRWDAPKGKR